jgi:hypothetical protein
MDLNINVTALVVYFLVIIFVPILALFFCWRYYIKHKGTSSSKVALSIFVIILLFVLLGLTKVALGRSS